MGNLEMLLGLGGRRKEAAIDSFRSIERMGSTGIRRALNEGPFFRFGQFLT